MASGIERTDAEEETLSVLQGDLLTPEEVAERLRVSRPTVYAWLKMGQLRGLRAGKVWRITPAALAAFVQQPPAKESTDTGRKYSREEILQFLDEDQLDEETRCRIEGFLSR